MLLTSIDKATQTSIHRKSQDRAAKEVLLVDLDLGARCSCTGHSINGKLCAHTQAARLADSGAGEVSDWHGAQLLNR